MKNKDISEIIKDILPKNTGIVDKSIRHLKEDLDNSNNYPVSDFSFRQGAMFVKEEILKSLSTNF